MPIRWTTVSRLSLLDQFPDILDGRSGVAFVGPDGAGKTTLAEALAAHRGEKVPVRVIGTASQAAVPFGAFGPLIAIADVGKPAALIRSALESLLAQTDGAPIIVDDAHLLDPLSATLVYQLARAAASRLIVTVRPDSVLPEAITALWDDELITRVDLGPLGAAEVAEALAATENLDADELYRRSGGNPLYLRLLAESGDKAREPTLLELADMFLADQPTPVRDALAYLSVHEPMSSADLSALAGDEAVAAGQATGALQIIESMVYGGHPCYVARAAAHTEPAAARRLRSTLVGWIGARPERDVRERLDRAVLAVDSDTPGDVDEVVKAAQEALRLGDLRLSERLASAALERIERFDARLVLANALAYQGRGREADSVLAAVDPAGLSEDQVMDWAVPRAANQFFMLSEPERATIFLHNTKGRISSPESRITLDALSSTFAMNAGNVGRALEIADEVLAAPEAPDTAVAWAASAAALCTARMGKFDQVGPMVGRALGAEHPGLLRFTVGLAETTTLLMSGQVDAAEETARRFTDFAELAQPGRSVGEVLLAQVLIARGDAAGAAALLGPASSTLERTGYSWGPLSLMYLATAFAQQDSIADAAKALSRAESRHGTKSALFAPELGVARAWRLATIGDTHSAITAARDAARMAERTGQEAIAVYAWHQAAQLGDTRAAENLAGLSAAVDCAYGEMAVAHARALASADAAGLIAAAERLAAAGFAGAAARAEGQAQRVRR